MSSRGGAALHERRAERPAFVERQQERETVHEVWRHDIRQRAPLVVRLADEPDVTEPQIAKTAVDQLRRGARRRAAEVSGLHQRDSETDPGGVRGDGRPDDAAADYQQVVVPGGELVEGTPARAQTAIGFAHAFSPAASVTSTRTWRAAGGTVRLAAPRAPPRPSRAPAPRA